MEKSGNKSAKKIEEVRQSYKKVSNILKGYGVKNNDFMLKINDKDLEKVDAYDLHLSLVTQDKIIKECTNNIWYFLREIARIPISLSGVAFIWAYLNRIDCWVTTYVDDTTVSVCLWLELWTIFFGHRHTKNISNIKKNEEVNIDTIFGCYKKLPQYIKDREKKLLKSRIKEESHIYDVVFYDEAESIPDIKTYYTSYDDQLISCKILLSKIKDYNKESCKDATEIIDKCYRFDSSMYDVDILDFKDNLYDDKYNGILHIEYTPYQNELGEEWYNSKREEISNDVKFLREVLLYRAKLDGEGKLAPITEEEATSVVDTFMRHFFNTYKFNTYKNEIKIDDGPAVNAPFTIEELKDAKELIDMTTEVFKDIIEKNMK